MRAGNFVKVFEILKSEEICGLAEISKETGLVLKVELYGYRNDYASITFYYRGRIHHDNIIWGRRQKYIQKV